MLPLALSRPVSTILALALACAPLGGCGEAFESLESSPEQLRDRVTASDPALPGSHCFEVEDFFRPGGIVGPEIPARLYYPVECEGDFEGQVPRETPLVLLHVANSTITDHTTYWYIAELLASHGFMVAVVSPSKDDLTGNTGQKVQQRADFTLQYLDYLMGNWPMAWLLDTDNLAIMGHSQGGEAAMLAAIDIDEGGLPYQVEAVVAMAPTKSFHTVLDYWASPFFLGLYGSRDDDVFGASHPNMPMDSVFAHYDHMGTEWSPFFFEDMVTKSMKFVHNWGHMAFRTADGVPDGTSDNKLAAAWIHAALEWRLRDDTSFKPWLTGNLVPPSLAGTADPSFTQYQDGELLSRRVVDNFENPWQELNTLSGDLITDGGVIEYAQWPWVVDASVPHGGTHLLVATAEDGDETLRWTVPAPDADMTSFQVLSLRAGQVHGYASTTSKKLGIRIKAGGQWSSVLDSEDYAQIPVPDEFELYNIDRTKSPMVTIRVPLEDFGVDVSQVEEIEVRYGWQDSIGARFIFDNLEFSR